MSRAGAKELRHSASVDAMAKQSNWNDYGSIQSDASEGLDTVMTEGPMRISTISRAKIWMSGRAGVVLFGTNIALLVVFYLVLLYGIVMEGIGIQEFMQPVLVIMPVCLLLFCALHSVAALGYKLSLIFIALVVVSAWFIEEIGVLSGIIFGQYHYTHITPAHLWSVPLEVPLSWFMVLYPSFCVSDLIIQGQAHHRRPKHKWLNLVTMSACTGFVMTGWDMSADPLGSTGSGLWVWHHNDGFYFGVPLLNFFGWFWTTALIIACYLLIEYYFPSQHLQKTVSVPVAALPLVAYLGILIFYATMSQPGELCLISLFTMGFPLLLATFRLVHAALRTEFVDFEKIDEEEHP